MNAPFPPLHICSSFFDSNLGSSLWYDVITTRVVELPHSALKAGIFHRTSGVLNKALNSTAFKEFFVALTQFRNMITINVLEPKKMTIRT